MYEQDVAFFNEVMGKHWEEYQRKLKQWCFLNHYDWSEDQMSETYLKCADLISRKGIEDRTDQGCRDYFFIAYKKNTFQDYYKSTRFQKSDDVDVYTLDVVCEDEIEELEEYTNEVTLKTNYILQRVREEFDDISYHIFRLRHLFQKDGKQLSFKEIKRITKVENTRSRLLRMGEFVKKTVGDEIKNNSERYQAFIKQYK